MTFALRCISIPCQLTRALLVSVVFTHRGKMQLKDIRNSFRENREHYLAVLQWCTTPLSCQRYSRATASLSWSSHTRLFFFHSCTPLFFTRALWFSRLSWLIYNKNIRILLSWKQNSLNLDFNENLCVRAEHFFFSIKIFFFKEMKSIFNVFSIFFFFFTFWIWKYFL